MSLEHLSDEQLFEYQKLYRSGMDKSKRFQDRKIHGMDTKYSYHVVRLLLEVEMLLNERDMDLERHREQLKAIRRGEWTEAQLRQWAQDKERELETAYANSSLPYGPDEPGIKALLLECLEMHYGDLSTAVVRTGVAEDTLKKIAQLTEQWR